MNDQMERGSWGEDRAARYLRLHGYRIVERNFRCRQGEIDIIAERYGELCFVEVKTRQGFDYGRPCESINEEKKQHIRRTAKEYIEELKRNGYYPRRVDFQVIEIVAEHHINAF